MRDPTCLAELFEFLGAVAGRKLDLRPRVVGRVSVLSVPVAGLWLLKKFLQLIFVPVMPALNRIFVARRPGAARFRKPPLICDRPGFEAAQDAPRQPFAD